MPHWLKACASWFVRGWLWVVALLALPNCSLIVEGPTTYPPAFERGGEPRTGAIFCDLERALGRRCATEEDRATGVRLAAAAVALNTGATGVVGLDESPEARGRCGGEPEAVLFEGAFPEGLQVCVNCGVIGPAPALFADATAACVALCQDLAALPGTGLDPRDPVIVDFCRQRARAATNSSIAACIGDACTTGGNPLPDFVDPRREPEAVVWQDPIGVTIDGNTLTRSAPTPATEEFDAGAASTQWIMRGDAYVEFSATETNLSHVVGLSAIPAGCAFPCTDAAASLADVDFAISLNRDGNFYVVESGTLVMPPGTIGGAFGTYGAGERFRVSLRDNSDGTASVSYSRLPAPCVAGTPCAVSVFHTHEGTASYPFRIVARFREQSASVANVTVVHIR